MVQQTDLSGLKSSVEVVFHSHGLSFSSGINALLKNVAEPDPANNNPGKTINAIAQGHGLTGDDVLALEMSLKDTRDNDPAKPLRI